MILNWKYVFFLLLKVYAKGILLFREVANSLKRLKSQFIGSTIILQGLQKNFLDIEAMLKQEKLEFEVSFSLGTCLKKFYLYGFMWLMQSVRCTNALLQDWWLTESFEAYFYYEKFQL